MVIWITGISGAGKSTIANALMKLLKKKLPELINIDGDEVREVYEEKLGYTEDDRILHIKRIQRLCLLLDRQKQIVITCNSHRVIKDYIRSHYHTAKSCCRRCIVHRDKETLS